MLARPKNADPSPFAHRLISSDAFLNWSRGAKSIPQWGRLSGNGGAYLLVAKENAPELQVTITADFQLGFSVAIEQAGLCANDAQAANNRADSQHE